MVAGLWLELEMCESAGPHTFFSIPNAIGGIEIVYATAKTAR